MSIENKDEEIKISYKDFKSQVISDYKIAVTSRECSVLGRREVFSGKENLEFLEMERNCLN